MDVTEIFWDSSVKDITNGYIYNEYKDEFICLICGKSYEKGIIYSDSDNFYEAEKYIKLHIKKEHKSVFGYLLNMDKRYTGLTDIQREFLSYYKDSCTDKDIAQNMGASQSTIRNHRFKLREKEKQAKIFLALMNILNEEKNQKLKINNKENLIVVHKGASMVDDRFVATQAESEKIIKIYFDELGHLKEFPAKEKKKILVLKYIMKNFTCDTKYTEMQINRVLKRIYDDFVTLRRSLIEYGFMDRKDDCSFYWVKE